MWAVVTVKGMSLVKREEKHHIRYQFKSKRATPPLERHCMCSSKLTVHHRRSEGETEVKTQQGKLPSDLTSSEQMLYFLYICFFLYFSHPFTWASVVLWVILSAWVRFLLVKIRLHVTCSLCENICFVHLCVGLRSGLFTSEECVANLQVLPSLCPTQQTGNLSHLSGFLCLDLPSALQYLSLCFFAVYVILVAWLSLIFMAGSFFIVHNPKHALSVRLAFHLFVFNDHHILCVSVLHLS